MTTITRFASRPSASRLLAAASLLLAAATPSPAETFFVEDSGDAIPAPKGSLRWAIEQAEANPGPDTILFTIDVDRILLVAPLPPLERGETTIVGGSIILDGRQGVSHAFEIRSPRNELLELGFESFEGSFFVLVEGGRADGNRIVGCDFHGRGTDPFAAVTGLVIRAGAGQADGPDSTLVASCEFRGFERAIEVTDLPPPSPSLPEEPRRRPTELRGNLFGFTRHTATPGAGNDTAIHVTASSSLLIRDNVISGPGSEGIHLAGGGQDVTVIGNEVGVLSLDGADCLGFDRWAIAALGPGLFPVAIVKNRVACAPVGIDAVAIDDLFVEGNSVGLPGTIDITDTAILVSDSAGLVRHNAIRDAAAAIRFGGTSQRMTAACNVAIGSSEPIVYPASPAIPPALFSSDLVTVTGQVFDADRGWVEMFGSDDGVEASEFQGGSNAGGIVPDFEHRLPVLALTIRSAAPGGVPALRFDTTDPINHRGTRGLLDAGASSEMSEPLPVEPLALTYDVISGRVKGLKLAPDGFVDLGAVRCLATGLDPSALPLALEEDPPVGGAFFYLVRRRHPAKGVPVGTYDAALCGPDLELIPGNRKPESGDCPP